MQTWMIMMGLQVIFFLFSGACVILWMRGETDIYDEKLMESARTYVKNRPQHQRDGLSSDGARPKSGGQS